MGSLRIRNTMIAILGTLTVTIGLIQCTKDNEFASQIDRDLVANPDSTVFSPFYDSLVIDKSDVSPDANDVIRSTGVQTIVRTYCASPSCHGGNISPKLTNYEEIKSLVSPGNPEGSKLYELITTTDVTKAMPPINYGSDLSVTEKTKVYNWIKNGAKEKPDLTDFRPAAVALITIGCASANCHNQATLGGNWARRNRIEFAPSDTVNFAYTDLTGRYRNYAQLLEPKLSQVWGAYKDSVRKFYADTVANASFRLVKTLSEPTVPNTRSPLNTYDDILLDIIYPKGARSQTRVQYTDPVSGAKYYVKGDNLDVQNSLLYQIDNTLLTANPRTKEFTTDVDGEMATDDGGLSSSEIALIKAWYFADPNIPDVWKYGRDGTGIFKYAKSGTIIRK